MAALIGVSDLPSWYSFGDIWLREVRSAES